LPASPCFSTLAVLLLDENPSLEPQDFPDVAMMVHPMVWFAQFQSMDGYPRPAISCRVGSYPSEVVMYWYIVHAEVVRTVLGTKAFRTVLVQTSSRTVLVQESFRTVLIQRLMSTVLVQMLRGVRIQVTLVDVQKQLKIYPEACPEPLPRVS
jgi:phenylalanine-4-hydroxylase